MSVHTQDNGEILADNWVESTALTPAPLVWQSDKELVWEQEV